MERRNPTPQKRAERQIRSAYDLYSRTYDECARKTLHDNLKVLLSEYQCVYGAAPWRWYSRLEPVDFD